MRSPDIQQQKMFFCFSPESRVPDNHPLRPIKAMVNECLESLSGEFSKMYSTMGRPLIPPEKLLKAIVLQMLYSIRSERALVEHMAVFCSVDSSGFPWMNQSGTIPRFPRTETV